MKNNYSWVKSNYFNVLRADAEYYKYKYIDCEQKISALNHKRLEEIIEDIKDGPGGWDINTSEYVCYGVPMLRTVNIVNGLLSLEKCVYITEDKHKYLKRSKVCKNDVLLSVRGTIGKSAVYSNENEANLNAAVVKITVNNNVIQPYYLSCFFNCKYGRIQTERISNGAVQKNMNLTETKNNLIPVPSPEIQKYIGDKVRKAEELREKSQRLKEETNEILNIEILDVDKQEIIENKGKWVKKDNIFTERLEPEYYANRYLHAEQIIKKQKHETLGNIIEKIQDGPGGWSISTNDYVNDGVPIVRGVNIGNDGEFINKGFVYITTEKNRELKKTEVRPGQVLLTVRGTVGRATVMPNYIEKANLNAAVVKIKVKENIIDPYYLAGFFNSSIGRLQTSRIANGAVQLNMNLSECKTNLIPIPSMEIQQKYRTKFLEFLGARDQSKQLIQEAKQDVEDLIEGNFDMSKLN